MQRLHKISSFYKSASALCCCGFMAVLALPAQAQGTGGVGFTTLSDVAGPFLGNVQPGVTPLTPPTSVSVSVSSLDTTTRDIILSQQPNLGEVLKICVHLAANMDKMSPFAGCSDVKWSAYNRAVRDAKQLNRELARAVQTQKTALAASPSPTQREAILQRLELIEKTTTALESTTATLAIFGQAINKAR